MTQDERKAQTRQTVTDLGVMTVLGVVLALIGPFGTFTVPFAWRLVYWVVLGWGGYACYRPITGYLVHQGRALDLPEPAVWIGACLIATLPMTVLVWWVGRIPGPFTPPSLEGALTLYGYVLVIGASVTALFYFIERSKGVAGPESSPAPDMPEPSAPADPAFFQRIPPRLGTDLIALEMEDHYLRIHTALGSDLILMRMRDAVAELAGVDGAQVHRSWWVARSGVTGHEREGRNLRLILSTGQRVPVARDAMAGLKSAGWT